MDCPVVFIVRLRNSDSVASFSCRECTVPPTESGGLTRIYEAGEAAAHLHRAVQLEQNIPDH